MKNNKIRFTKPPRGLIYFLDLANTIPDSVPSEISHYSHNAIELISPPSIPPDNLKRFLQAAKGKGTYGKEFWKNEDWKKEDSGIEFYKLFYFVRFTFVILWMSGGRWMSPFTFEQYPVELSAEGEEGIIKFETRSDKKEIWFNAGREKQWKFHGLVVGFIERLKEALKGCPSSRIRLCPVCGVFFWAKYNNSSACSGEHSRQARVWKSRKNRSEEKVYKDNLKRRIKRRVEKLLDDRKTHIQIFEIILKEYKNEKIKRSELEKIIDSV